VRIVGIDVGKGGCAAELSLEGGRVQGRPVFYDPPLNAGEWDPYLFVIQADQWKNRGVQRIVIERVHAMPASFRGGIAGSEMMFAYGMWLASLAAFFPPEQVRPVSASTWKKVMGVTYPVPKGASNAQKDEAYKKRKALAVETASRLIPGETFVTPRGRLLDGKAEACLIALYEDAALRHLSLHG
jgi:hypothetical protein